MEMKKSTKSVIIGIIFMISILGTSGATYYFLDKEINSLTTDKSDLNDQIHSLVVRDSNRNDFDYNLINGYRKYIDALEYVGSADYSKKTGELYYDIDDMELAGIYHSLASGSYSLAADDYRNAEIFWSKAKENITNRETEEFIYLYISYINLSIEFYDLAAQMQEIMGWACSYYSSPFMYTSGDYKVEEYNSYLDEYNDLVELMNDGEDEIDLFWVHTWK